MWIPTLPAVQTISNITGRVGVSYIRLAAPATSQNLVESNSDEYIIRKLGG
jgi:hypothetical protein